MSGTSHDGISAALVRIEERDERPSCELLAFHTFPYRRALRERILSVTEGDQPRYPRGTRTTRFEAGGSTVAELSAVNVTLGRALGEAALKLFKRAGVAAREVALIGSHGHTFFHLPPHATRRGQTSSTLQLGEPAMIAALTGVPVVADFRPMDMALGGQGAPLAPLAHLFLFGDPTRGRVVQNIGGIANSTYLPPGARLGDPRLIAFDSGPGSMVIDALASRTSRGKLRMDRNGRLAARGKASDLLLAELMGHPYFHRRPPKSTGREQFGLSFVRELSARGRALKLSELDLIATATALTARSIGEAVRRFVTPLGPVEQLIVAGGGAHNGTLMRMLKAEMPRIEVLTADQVGVDGDAVEAMAFAILAYEMARGRAGNIPSVTGARRPAILGKLTLPPSLPHRVL
jgi:anhydro-N-acetylmuramic acid kinase